LPLSVRPYRRHLLEFQVWRLIVFAAAPWSTYLLLIYNVFTADTLRHAVTLTFDPLTLNVSVSAVTLTNCANLSEIDNQRRIYCNLNMSVLAPSAMLVLTQARLYNFAASEYENAPVRHISTKSVNVRLLY